MADVTIGDDTPGGYSIGSIGNNAMYMSQFTLAGSDASSIVKKLRARIRNTSGSTTYHFRAYVYSTGGTLMASNEFTILPNTVDSIVEATFGSGATMTDGTYYLGVHQETATGGFGFGFITTGITNGKEKTQTYASGLPSPLGAVNAQSSLRMCVEADVGAVVVASTFVPQIVIVS